MKRILIAVCALALLMAGCTPALAAEASESQEPVKNCYYPIAVDSYTSGPFDELRISKTYQENICQGGFHPKDEIPCKLEFVELTRAKYTTNPNEVQSIFIGPDSNGKQCPGIYPALLVGGRRPPSPR